MEDMITWQFFTSCDHFLSASMYQVTLQVLQEITQFLYSHGLNKSFIIVHNLIYCNTYRHIMQTLSAAANSSVVASG